MNYQEALDYLHSFINYERKVSWQYPEAVGLDRMRALAKALGNPQNAYETIIIAGSKGKGSTAVILSSILRMENLKVGLYTSPHLVDVRERIQVNGLPISEMRFIELMHGLKRVLGEYAWKKEPPTYFEILTAIAFCHFKDMKVHVAVLEVGLGGLYDSTNIACAKVAGVTPISLEHTDKLGKTVSKIAVQKCGIIKGREIVVSGVQPPEAEEAIRKTCAQREAEFWRVGADIRFFERQHGEDFQRFDIKSGFGNYFDLELRLLGQHQVMNAAQAVGLAKAFEKKTRFKISDSAVRQGIADARWPGRLEKIDESPLVVLDGAHNPESVKKLIAGLKRHLTYEKLFVVFGVSSDKDLEGILGELMPELSCLIVTEFESPRALKTHLIAHAAESYGKDIVIEENPLAAYDKARALASSNDLVLVTGSLYLVGEIKGGYASHRV